MSSRRTPITGEELTDVRSADSDLSHARIAAGKAKHQGDTATSRGFGPLWPIFDEFGSRIDVTDNKHPYGPKKRKYERAEFDCNGFDDFDVFCYDCSYVLSDSVILISQKKCSCT